MLGGRVGAQQAPGVSGLGREGGSAPAGAVWGVVPAGSGSDWDQLEGIKV